METILQSLQSFPSLAGASENFSPFRSYTWRKSFYRCFYHEGWCSTLHVKEIFPYSPFHHSWGLLSLMLKEHCFRMISSIQECKILSWVWSATYVWTKPERIVCSGRWQIGSTYEVVMMWGAQELESVSYFVSIL